MNRKVCLVCAYIGIASIIYAQKNDSINSLSAKRTGLIFHNEQISPTNKEINDKLRELEFEQKEILLAKYSTELGILLSAFGVIFAAFTIGFPIYAIQINKKMNKHLEKGKAEIWTKIEKLEEHAQTHIQEKVHEIDIICENAREIKKKLDAVSSHSIDNIDTDDTKSADYKNQAEIIEQDKKATDIQKACAKFYAKFFEGNFNAGIVQYNVIINKYKDEIAVSEVDKLGFYVGLCYYKLGKFKESLTFLRRYNKTTENVRCWYYLANCYLQLKEYNSAIIYFEKCKNDSSVKKEVRIMDNVLSGLGMCYLEIMHYDEALTHFKEALIAHEDIEDYINIAKVYISKAQHDRFLRDEWHVKESYFEGINTLMKGLEQCSSKLDVGSRVIIYTILGEIHLALNENVKALNWYKEILKQDESNLTAWLNILQLYREYETLDRENRTYFISKAKQLVCV